jgi:hypothetical protein
MRVRVCVCVLGRRALLLLPNQKLERKHLERGDRSIESPRREREPYHITSNGFVRSQPAGSSPLPIDQSIDWARAFGGLCPDLTNPRLDMH